jgi:hypothetical protein
MAECLFGIELCSRDKHGQIWVQRVAVVERMKTVG